MNPEYTKALEHRIARVFEANPQLVRPTARLPGYVGDHLSGVFFIAQNMTPFRVAQAAAHPEGHSPPNLFLLISRGGRMLRQEFVDHGFKDAPFDDDLGWHCYVTNLVKHVIPKDSWKQKNEFRRRVTLPWAEILAWELKEGMPRLIVLLGEEVDRSFNLLTRDKRLPPLPKTICITHFSKPGLSRSLLCAEITRVADTWLRLSTRPDSARASGSSEHQR